MKSTILLGVVAVLLCAAAPVLAIDRDAGMIDNLTVDMAYLDEADSFGASIWGEQALRVTDWAVLAGLGHGTISPDDCGNWDYWRMSLGLKYYYSRYSSFSGVGEYTIYQDGEDLDTKSALFTFKYRLLPADEAISPYLKLGVGVRHRSTFSDRETDDDDVSEALTMAGGGCEFAMTDSFSFVFEAQYVAAKESDNGAEDLDGWLGAATMQYYFE
ncbi:outer membrane beta-barrel protein [Verrucomicrobiota bacterium]